MFLIPGPDTFYNHLVGLPLTECMPPFVGDHFGTMVKEGEENSGRDQATRCCFQVIMTVDNLSTPGLIVYKMGFLLP